MAYFANINDNDIVTSVIVVADSDAPNEAAGIAFCQNLLGANTNWVETKDDGSIRCRYASIGMNYDSTNDVFYTQSPYSSWVLNTSTWEWEAPVAMPDDEGYNESDAEFVSYTWDEGSTTWTSRTVTT